MDIPVTPAFDFARPTAVYLVTGHRTVLDAGWVLRQDAIGGTVLTGGSAGSAYLVPMTAVAAISQRPVKVAHENGIDTDELDTDADEDGDEADEDQNLS